MSESEQVKNTRGKGEKKGKSGNSTKPESRVNPSVAIGQIIALMSELKVEDRIMAAKAAAGLAGMVALFPNQIPQRGKTEKTSNAGGPKKEKKEKKDKPVQAVNPLKDSEIYRIFRAAQLAMTDAKKANGGKELSPDDPVCVAYKEALEEWKNFRDQNK